MTTTLDMSMNLWEVCNVFHADTVKLATLIELMGGLSEEQTDRVLYQASIVAAAEKFSKTKEKE
ncbi:hypothetical protein [uncultured Ruminococcus sp.]|uniref:hypothetical protein n=1 Tax=uncultured Ruminococcus sp. TaxID=165186 RepID=UPI002602C531|nr:hypothetical protein [uncultured Ruminococcus sp.]